MSPATEATIRLDVAAYVEEVRRCFADLSPDERDELTGGLEADLTERLHETPAAGDLRTAFGDPRQYADELRAAAGLDRPTSSSRVLWTLPDAERLRQWWEPRAAEPGAHAVLTFFAALRPVWWVLRGWIAVQTLDFWFGGWPHDWLPGFHGSAGGFLLLVAAVIGSVQMGRGRWWPGTVSTGWPRWLFVAANVFAVAMIPAVISQLPTSHDVSWATRAYYRAQPAGQPGLRMHGHPVRNIYAYDLNGQPLVGVQLFDQDGNPLEVRASAQEVGRHLSVTYPWGFSAGTDGWRNVFPLPTREQVRQRVLDDAFASDNPPVVVPPPFVRAPAVPQLPESALQPFYDATGTAPTADGHHATGPSDSNHPGKHKDSSKPSDSSKPGDSSKPSATKQGTGKRPGSDVPKQRRQKCGQRSG